MNHLTRIYAGVYTRAQRLAGRQAASVMARKALREIWNHPPDLRPEALEGYRDQLMKSFGWLLKDD